MIQTHRREAEFPFIPGEVSRIPAPSFTWANAFAPPTWVIATLHALDSQADPKGPAPKEWRSEIERDGDSAAIIRALAEERAGLSTEVRDYRGRIRLRTLVLWRQRRPEKVFSPARPAHPRPVDGQVYRDANGRRGQHYHGQWFLLMGAKEAWDKAWIICCQLVLGDLAKRRESVHAAKERLPREWKEMRANKEEAFLAIWMKRAFWPPHMAAAWLAFDEPVWLARYFNCGADMPTDGISLSGMCSSLEGEIALHVVDRKPAETLLEALRCGENEGRVVVIGELYKNGAQDGVPAEISPAALSHLRWRLGDEDGVMLEQIGWSVTNRTSVYSRVMINRQSLFAAFAQRDLASESSRPVRRQVNCDS